MSEYQTKLGHLVPIATAGLDQWATTQALETALRAHLDAVQKQTALQNAEIERLRKYNELLMSECDALRVQLADRDAAPTSLIERVQEDSTGPLQAALQERMRVDVEEALAFATGLG